MAPQRNVSASLKYFCQVYLERYNLTLQALQPILTLAVSGDLKMEYILKWDLGIPCNQTLIPIAFSFRAVTVQTAMIKQCQL